MDTTSMIFCQNKPVSRTLVYLRTALFLIFWKYFQKKSFSKVFTNSGSIAQIENTESAEVFRLSINSNDFYETAISDNKFILET